MNEAHFSGSSTIMKQPAQRPVPGILTLDLQEASEDDFIQDGLWFISINLIIRGLPIL